jgi:hypothetical protein
MEGHMAFVATTKVGSRVLRPLIGLSKQHAVLVVLVYVLADTPNDVVGFR